MPPLPNLINRALSRVRDIILRRRKAIFAHHIGFCSTCVPSIIVPDLPVAEGDVVLAERLLKAYRAATTHRREVGSEDIWTIVSRRQAKFFGILDANEPRTLALYLAGMNRHDATIGTVQGSIEYHKILRNSRYRRFLALQAKDKLVSLAEAVGALPCENPEQGPWAENLALSPDLLVEKIETAIGMKITPPATDGGLLKIKSRHGLFNERDLNAIYTGWLLKTIILPGSDVSIAEIGAGVGRVAYWATQYAFRSYTIFDLPHINVLQGFYLQKAMPGRKIALYGEQQCSEGVTVLPDFEFESARKDSFSLILNQDSFPEIDGKVVSKYLEEIRAKSPRFFLSINHESRPRAHGSERQVNVAELVSAAGGFRRLSRQLYWLRKGYVIELYAVADAQMGDACV